MTQGMYKSSILERANSMPSALERAEKHGQLAQGMLGKTQPNIPKPGKTIAGGAMSALGAGGAGAAMAQTLLPTAVAAGPAGWSMAAGAALLGGAQYFES